MTYAFGPIRQDDVGELARLHRVAFPGFFLSTLGENFLREFYSGYLNDDTAVTVVARDEFGVHGAVVGTVCPAGFFRRLLRRRWRGFLLASIRAAAMHPSAIPRLARGVFYRGDSDNAPTAALLSSICVNPDLQGCGIGHELIVRWRESARALGATSAVLTTDAETNDEVNRFYLRDGWSLDATFRTHEGRLMNRYRVELGVRAC